MANDKTPSHPASCENLFDPEPDAGNCLRLGLLAAAAIHFAIFAITWPTMARTEPIAPHQNPDVFLLETVVFDLTPPKME
jgi:hypothetical protein